MPLLNSTIQQLNEITTNVKNKNELSADDELMIKKIFNDINKRSESYDVNEIEAWFENEGSWTNKDVRVRVTNISHYTQTKYEQTNKFRIVTDDDSCSCGE
jgi:3-methyladenine DNA glycosylase AlkC